MTLLPTVRRQLEEAAERLASGRSSRQLSRSGTVIDRVRGVRAGGWMLATISAAVVVVVVLAIARVHGPDAPPVSMTAVGGPGLVAPILGNGDAWSVVAIEQDTTPWRPPTAFNNPSAPPPITLSSSSRAAVVVRAETFSWTLPSGDGRGRTRSLGRPRFIGTAGERALWRANGSRSPLQLATGGLSTTSQTGFTVGQRNFSYRQLLHFPTDPAAVARLFTGAVSNQVGAIAATLAQVPLPPAARVALFNSLTRLSGVQNLGMVRDPLGRLGIGLAAPSAAPPRQPSLGPFSRVGTPLPTREQLIFDPRTKALLATETVLVKASAVAGIGIGYPTSWTAYTVSRAVRAASVPGLTQPPPCAPGQVELSLGPSVAPQTGEHAYLFVLSNRLNTPCSLDGYPTVNLNRRDGRLPFVYRNGGAPYVTTRKPRSVTLAPGSRAYFLLAKYRCDIGVINVATTLSISLPNSAGVTTVNLSRLRIGDLEYCRKQPGTRGTDPGNRVTLSPIEPTQRAALAPPP